MSFFMDFQDPDPLLGDAAAAAAAPHCAPGADSSASAGSASASALAMADEGFDDSAEEGDFAAALADLRAAQTKTPDGHGAAAGAKGGLECADRAESKEGQEVAGGAAEGKEGELDDARLAEISGRASLRADAKLTETQKSNTTSTLYVRSTISVPDVDKILLSVSILLHQMVAPAPEDEDTDFILQLTAKMEQRTRWELGDGGGGARAAVHETTVENIFAFMKNAYEIAQWSPECNVLSMVLLTRLVASTEMTFNARNWDKLLLCALLLAQKLWDDTPLANVDFPELWRQIFPGVASTVDLKLVNQMEKMFLQKLNYDIHVDRATYTKVYFELHALTDDKEQFALRPLADKEGRALEAHTRDLKSSLFSSVGTMGAGSGYRSPPRDQGAKVGGSTIAVGHSSWDSRSQQSEAKGQGRVVLS